MESQMVIMGHGMASLRSIEIVVVFLLVSINSFSISVTLPQMHCTIFVWR